MIGTPKEPDFFKSTVLGVDDGVQGLGVGELCHPFHQLDKSQIEVRGGRRHLANQPLDGGDIPSTGADDEVQGEGGVGELHHPQQFGRGQTISSVGTGWKPKPNQWKLLGGIGGKPTKKTGPKAKESGKLNHIKTLSVCISARFANSYDKSSQFDRKHAGIENCQFFKI